MHTDAPIHDAAGTAHEPYSGDPRILSLVPSVTELVAALGLGSNLVGRTQWCIHPREIVERVPTVGGTKKINLKRARALRPTHALLNIDENTKDMAAALAEFVPHIVVTHPNRPEDNLALYELAGRIFRRESEAQALSNRFNAAWNDLRAAAESAPARNVLYLIWKDPWMTISRDTYIARMLETIHWRHAVHDPERRYPEVAITPEFVAKLDFVLFSSEPYTFKQHHLDAFAETFTCPPKKLQLVDGERLSWYGPRAIPGLAYLQELAQLPAPATNG